MTEAIENALNVPEAKTTVGDMILRAIDVGAARVDYRFVDKDGRAVAAFVVISGEHTQDFLDALDDESERIESAGDPNDE